MTEPSLRPRRLLRSTALAAVIALVCLGAACAMSSPTATTTGRPATQLHVVAAENFWGNIAGQLGGRRVEVKSIITNPDTDPHSYEATPRDGRTIASAQLVIVNGLGYDTWAKKLLDANPVPGRTVLTVGQLVGKKEGDNPHRWYFPGDVETVIAHVSDAYKKLDPVGAGYFDEQMHSFETVALAKYKSLIDDIKRKYAGTKVGASESIFVGIAQAAGLDLVTPASYLTAISEGTDPTAHDKSTVDNQIKSKEIKVFVYNSQNSTPDVQTLVTAAKANKIPVSTVTETLAPPNVSFQDWQSAQLQNLANALATATGR